MKSLNSVVSFILGCFLFLVFVLVNCIMDMSMEGNSLAYPRVGYLIPSLILSLLLITTTVIMKRNKRIHQLRMVGCYFFVASILFMIVFFPAIPTVCYEMNLYARLARLCCIVNIAIPLSWLY